MDFSSTLGHLVRHGEGLDPLPSAVHLPTYFKDLGTCVTLAAATLIIASVATSIGTALPKMPGVPTFHGLSEAVVKAHDL